jgi:ribosomal protein S18 acetylase RimI-like enzyme
VIRTATTEDTAAVARILLQVQDQHVRDYPSIFRSMTKAEAEKLIAGDVEAGSCLVHQSDAVDGFLRWVVQERPENAYVYASRLVVVDQIGVDERCRRRGIGCALLAWVVERGRGLGAQRVQLDSWAANTAAHGAFRKAGFSVYNLRFWKQL